LWLKITYNGEDSMTHPIYYCKAGTFMTFETYNVKIIEALRIKLRRIFDPHGIIMFPIRSLTPQQAAGHVLAAGFITNTFYLGSKN
jgi:hypothetical protein